MSEKELMTKEQLDRRKEVEVLKEKEKDLIMNKTTMEIEISVLRDKLNVHYCALDTNKTSFPFFQLLI